jgi:hypothetical protein
MSEPAAHRWVLLIHQLPRKPEYLRVKVWRRLQRLGAVPIKNSVYVLPRTDATVEDFQWELREIMGGGGEASVCEATFVDGLTDREIEALFKAARASDYRDLAAAAKRLKAPSPRADTTLTRLKRRLAEVVAIDFFGAPGRHGAENAVRQVETRLRSPERRSPPAAAVERIASVRGRTWVTRRGVFVDRIASAWLIRRFIDSKARFKFVSPAGSRPAPRELRFDMYEAEYTHEGDRCTFETLVARFALTDPALRVIAEIVHDIDCKDSKFARDETRGVERLLAGVARETTSDGQRLERGAALLDALYAASRGG